VKFLFGDAFERSKLIDSGIVDENIDTAERLVCFPEEVINVLGLGDISFYNHCVAAAIFDFGDDAVGAFLAG